MRPPTLPANHRRRPLKWLLVLFVGFVLLAILVLVTENWRGVRAWNDCKRELEAKGAKLDWEDYIPAPVPDAENIFHAPKMAEWFVGRETNELTALLSLSRLGEFLYRKHGSATVETTVSPLTNTASIASCDLKLEYHPPLLVLAPQEGATRTDADYTARQIPFIQFQQTPLFSAIDGLARTAGLEITFDSIVKTQTEPNITLKWENISALQALVALLRNYNLDLVQTNEASARIARRKVGAPEVFIEFGTRQRLRSLAENAYLPVAVAVSNSSIAQADDFSITDVRVPSTKPIRLQLLADSNPGLNEIAGIMPASPGPSLGLAWSGSWRAAAIADNLFQIYADLPSVVTASDYLEWSDQFSEQFETIGEALKRPQARFDGDYSDPSKVGFPNFRAIRMLSFVILARAQSFLVAGESESALRELTRLHDLRHIQSAKPITLVAAMLNTAITDRYLRVVAEGLKRHAWSDAQLAAIQTQIEQLHHGKDLREAFMREQVAVCKILELESAKMFRRRFEYAGSDQWSARRWLATQAAKSWLHGWVYRNMAESARLLQLMVESYDLDRRAFFPERLREFSRRLHEIVKHPRPYTFLSAIATPNYEKAIVTTAYYQSLADMATVACALERHRLKHGQLPESLEQLTQEFVKRLPRDVVGSKPLNYRRKPSGSFTLYSIGWNERDDGGVGGSEAHSIGDWLWPPE